MIEGRTLSDLYSRMADGSPVDFDTDVLIPQNTKDKLWLLSDYECLKISSDSGARNWGDYYWLRSPYTSSTNFLIYSVYASGYISSNTGAAAATYSARPAFKISF